MNQRTKAPLREGQRVEFGADLARDHFTIPAGSTAVVEYVDDFLLTLTMDVQVPGLEPWDNQVDFKRDEFETAFRILHVLSDE